MSSERSLSNILHANHFLCQLERAIAESENPDCRVYVDNEHDKRQLNIVKEIIVDSEGDIRIVF